MTRAKKGAEPGRTYHNNGDGTFTDVTEKAGLGGEGHYGQGVAVGDFDNDGYPDLYVTHSNANNKRQRDDGPSEPFIGLLRASG